MNKLKQYKIKDSVRNVVVEAVQYDYKSGIEDGIIPLRLSDKIISDKWIKHLLKEGIKEKDIKGVPYIYNIKNSMAYIRPNDYIIFSGDIKYIVPEAEFNTYYCEKKD